MSNGDSVLESLFRVQTKVNELVCKGEEAGGERRDPQAVLEYHQRILTIPGEAGFMEVLRAPRTGSLNIWLPQEQWVPAWEKYYRDEHGVKVNLGPVLEAYPVVEHPEFSCPVFAIPEVGLNRAFAKCRDHYPCNSEYGDDLERAMRWHQRTTDKGPYLVRFRPRVEADEENKNTSANTLEERREKCIILPERVVLEDFVWCWTGGFHLDIQYITLCAGSRDSRGGVPSTYWRDDEFRVWSYNLGYDSGRLRARSAV